MKIERVELRLIEIPFTEPFEIASYRFLTKTALILKAWTREGYVGWAEGEHLETPWYVPETVASGWSLLSEVIIPNLIGLDFSSAEEVVQHFSWIQGNQLSLAAVDVLAWDLIAQHHKQNLAGILGGIRNRIPAGISLGLCTTPEQLVERVSDVIAIGYQRVKIKIKPGKDIAYLEAVRKEFPHAPIMADANSSYLPTDSETLKILDHFDLMMIEQPYENGDLVHHAELAAVIETPICLDESIHTMHEARSAVALGVCEIVNIKPPRIGGLSSVRQMERFFRNHGIPIWCGGMLETGLGRAVNLACASLEGFCLPGDLAAPRTYLEQDIVADNFDLQEDGTIKVPNRYGIGVQVDEEYINYCTTRLKIFP